MTTSLDRARAYFSKRAYAESEAEYRTHLGANPNDPAAFSGLGMIKLVQKKNQEAAALFENALRQAPTYADAWYGKAVVAERSNDLSEAMMLYSRALGANPNHAGAKAGLEKLKDRAKSPPQPPASEVSHPTPLPNQPSDPVVPRITKTPAFISYIQSLNSPQAIHAMRRMDALAMDYRTPRKNAFLGWPMFWAALTIFWMFLSMTRLGELRVLPIGPPIGPLLFLGSTLLCLIFIGVYVKSRFTRYKISAEWIMCRTGIISVTEKTYEIIHVDDATEHYGLMERLTGNGTLRLSFEKKGTLKIKGLIPAEDVQAFKEDILTLSRILRGFTGIVN